MYELDLPFRASTQREPYSRSLAPHDSSGWRNMGCTTQRQTNPERFYKTARSDIGSGDRSRQILSVATGQDTRGCGSPKLTSSPKRLRMTRKSGLSARRLNGRIINEGALDPWEVAEEL
jgi:hypothetical protein